MRRPPRDPLVDVGEAETEAFWTEFLRGLVKRGLIGVQLAISDAHAGLKAAIAKVLACAWLDRAVPVTGERKPAAGVVSEAGPGENHGGPSPPGPARF